MRDDGGILCCPALIVMGLFTRLCGLGDGGVCSCNRSRIFTVTNQWSALGQWFGPPAGRDHSGPARGFGCCWLVVLVVKGGGRWRWTVFWLARRPLSITCAALTGLGRVIPARKRSSPAANQRAFLRARDGRPKVQADRRAQFASSRTHAMWWNACSPVLAPKAGMARGPAPRRGDTVLADIDQLPFGQRFDRLAAGIAVFRTVRSAFSSHFFGVSYVLG